MSLVGLGGLHGNKGLAKGKPSSVTDIAINPPAGSLLYSSTAPVLTGIETSVSITGVAGSLLYASSAPTIVVGGMTITDPGAYIWLTSDSSKSVTTTLSVADTSDGGSGTYDLSVVVTEGGTFTLSTVTGLTFSVGTGSGDASMTFNGTIANINTALTNATFQGLVDEDATATVTFTRDSDSEFTSSVIGLLALPALETANIAENVASGYSIFPNLTTALTGSTATVAQTSTVYDRPLVTNIVCTDNTDGTFDLDFNVDTAPGDAYYVVTTDVTARSGGSNTDTEISNIISGTNLDGSTTGRAAFGGPIAVNATGAQTIANINAGAGTYNVLFVVRLDATDGTSAIDGYVELDAVVVTNADVTAPTLTTPTGTQTGSTTATITVDTNEANGTLYWVVDQSATPPSASQVKSGLDNGGAAADQSGSAAVSGTGTQTVNVTGLTASTTYYAYFMHEDAATNQSTVSSSTSFTTAAANPSIVNIGTATPTLDTGSTYTSTITSTASQVFVAVFWSTAGTTLDSASITTGGTPTVNTVHKSASVYPQALLSVGSALSSDTLSLTFSGTVTNLRIHVFENTGSALASIVTPTDSDVMNAQTNGTPDTYPTIAGTDITNCASDGACIVIGHQVNTTFASLDQGSFLTQNDTIGGTRYMTGYINGQISGTWTVTCGGDNAVGRVSFFTFD